MTNLKYHAKLLPNQCYHILNHAVGTENLFKQPRNYAYFLEKWHLYISPYFVNYAYCLMPNHFHFLSKAKPITPALIEKIKKENTAKARAYLAHEIGIKAFYESQFQRFFTTYAKAINKQEENRYGSLFKAQFKRILIENEVNFLEKLHYIHHNPIHHDFAVNYLDWEYCSYAAYVDELKEKGLSKKPVLKLFDNNLQNFIESHKRYKANFRK